MLRNLALAGLVAAGTFLLLPTPPGGRLVKIYGDLRTASRVVVIVPGTDTTAQTFDDGTHRPGGAARALLAEAARLAPRARLAVVAWLGYDAPRTLSLDTIGDGAARAGAAELRRTVAELRGRTDAPVALLCHSYGSVVCARAMPGPAPGLMPSLTPRLALGLMPGRAPGLAPGLPVSGVAFFGSPGVGAPSAAALTAPPRAVTPPSAPRARGSARGSDRGYARGSDPGDARESDPGSARESDSGDARESARGHVSAAGGVPARPRVWAGLAANDWIRFVPKTTLGPLGFGTDPMSPGFGARVFDAGSGGHSDYFEPGTASLRNLTMIALGRSGQVTG
ncbi:alpha/beta hydrolase [Nonomuraea mesophila]|nr:alpha/beta hydrolase [Nonomuraea mesophila]